MTHDTDILTTAVALSEAGCAIHWLRPRGKAPVEAGWSEATVNTAERLRATHQAGYNIGVRLGEPSATPVGFLHCLDFDIRVADQADEVWAAFARLLPGISRDSLAEVQSGSGGESRHLYFVTDRPFRSKRLWTSDGKHRGADGKWHYDSEIELFGSGKQTALPPSIHPSGKPYRWVRKLELDGFDLPYISAAAIEALGAVDHQTFAFESREPLEFKPGQLEADLDLIHVSDLHYDDWIRLGQALHHQFGGAQEGFDLWLQHTRRSAKFTGEQQVREMRRIKWRSFGKYRGQPVTMGTVRQWARDARHATLADEFDDLDTTPEPRETAENGDFDNLLSTTSSDDDWDGGKADEPTELSWTSLLDFTEENAIRPNLHNLRLIVEHDVRTAGTMAFNEFTQEVVQRASPGEKPPRRAGQPKPVLQLSGSSWHMRDPVNGDWWTEDKDNAIRAVIEAPKTQGGYGFKVPDRDLRAAIDIVGRKNCFHPVRDYLGGLTWDGKPRVERLFIDYLGAPDDAYARSVATLTLIAGVARVMEPGCKFDYSVILQGLQGKRKSTFISVLAKNWFAELEGEIDDPKQMVEMMQGAWILELPELGGFVRADVRHIKAFISRRSDKVRLAYAKRAQEYHRQSIFFGSTNDVKYLKDDTGNRRFWPINCRVESIDTDRLEREVDQLWAEAQVLYRAMREKKPRGSLPLFLTGEAHVIAERLQESARVESAEDGIAGSIEAWLQSPVFTGDMNDPIEGHARDATCLREIWAEALGRDLKDYSQLNAQMLGRAMSKIKGWTADGKLHTFAKYGRQRLYQRV